MVRASWSNLVPAPHDQMALIEKFSPELNNKLIGKTVRARVSQPSYVSCGLIPASQPAEVEVIAEGIQNTSTSPQSIRY